MCLSKLTIAIPVDNVIRVCVHIAMKYSRTDYINTIDHCNGADVIDVYENVDYVQTVNMYNYYIIML